MKSLQIYRLCVTALIAFLGTAAVKAEEPVKIGVVTPFTGTYAPIGQQVRWGLVFATREINASGGILGRPIQLVFEDSEANIALATRGAERLFQVDQVDFLTGTVNSGATIAVGKVAERHNKLMATTVSFSDAVTGEKCSPNVFRVNASASMQAGALASWLSSAKPKAKMFYLGPDYEMGRSTVSAFKAHAEAAGATTVGEVFAPLGTQDYSQYIAKIEAAQPDVLYTSMAGNDTVYLLTQLEKNGILARLQVLGASGTVTTQNIGAMGKAAEGFVTGVGYSPLIDTPENKAFGEVFKAANNIDPDLYGVDSYGLMYLYKAAAEKAHSLDTAKLREVLGGLEWMTPQGKKTIRAADHQAMMNMYVVQVRGSAFKILSTIPAEKSIGPVTCPAAASH